MVELSSPLACLVSSTTAAVLWMLLLVAVVKLLAKVVV